MKLFLNEDIEPIKMPTMEDIDGDVGTVTLYRVAFSHQAESIFKYGYNRVFTGTEGGNAYGPGVYCTTNLKDTIYNVRTKPQYGDCIIKMKLADGFKKFIIFDGKLAKQVYGDNWRIRHQLEYVAKFDHNEAIRIEQYLASLRDCDLYYGRTAPAARALWCKYDKSIFTKHGVRGLVYTGLNDGHVALPYDFSSVIPYSVSYDQGRTFKKKLTQETYQFLKDHTDVGFHFGKYSHYLESINGFTMIQRKDGKYNIIRNETGKTISPIWFDNVVGQINPSDDTFGFFYRGYEFEGTTKSPEAGVDGCVIDPMEGNPCCDFSALDDIVDEMKRNNISSFEEFYQIQMEQNDDDQNNLSETKQKLQMIIENMVRQQLFESHLQIVDNIDEIIDMIGKHWKSNDDVWWIKIDSRLKDFKGYNRRNPGKRQKFWSRVNFVDGTRRENHVGYVIIRGATKEACQDSLRNAVVHLNPWAAKMCGSDTVYSNGNAEALKMVCNRFFARSYITINKRSMESTIKISRLDKQKGLFKGREFHHRVGQTRTGIDATGRNWEKERPLGLIDCDIDDPTAQAKLDDYLKKNNVNIILRKPSHDGMHYIVPIDDVRGLDFSFLDKYATNNRPGDPNVLFKPDANLLVYSAVG